MSYVEKKTELKRRRRRREKLRKLKGKLAKAKTPADTQAVMQKIKSVSPFWQPQTATPAPETAAKAARPAAAQK